MAKDGFFSTGDPEREVDHTVEFPVGTNGTYDFVCEPHESAGMVGTITVEPAPPVEVEAAPPEAAGGQSPTRARSYHRPPTRH